MNFVTFNFDLNIFLFQYYFFNVEMGKTEVFLRGAKEKTLA